MGIKIPRTVAAQFDFLKKNGIVSNNMSNVPTGAVLMKLGGGGRKDHAGIYLGNGMVAEASSSFVRKRSLSGFNYWGMPGDSGQQPVKKQSGKQINTAESWVK